MPISDDVKLAYAALTAKQERYTLLWRYYDADPPMRYVSDRLREVFKNQEARFSQNLASVVIDAEADRIQLREFTIATNAPAQERLNDLFRRTGLELDADDLHLATLVCGEAFLFIWQDDDGEVEAYYNDPRLCHLFYDAEKPHRKRMAAKWWTGTDEKRYLNLYYPERIEYYVSRGKAENVNSASAFVEAQPAAANPFGTIPVFHFRRERRRVISALKNVLEPQDAHNKLFQDMMVAAEFGAFPQRYAITNADIGPLRNAPNEIWHIPSGDGEGQGSSVGAFDATNLANYLDAMDKIATGICITTRTPKHYVFAQGGDPSGEALIAMEAPLNKKVAKTIERLKPEWAAAASFLLRVDGTAEVAANDITPVFEAPETVQPRTEAEIREISVRAGIPLTTVLRREGWTENELAQLEQDRMMQDSRTAGAALGDRDLDATADMLERLGIGDLIPAEVNGDGS